MVLLALIGVCVSECVKTQLNVDRAFVAGLSQESRLFCVFARMSAPAWKQSQVLKGFDDAFPLNFNILGPLMPHYAFIKRLRRLNGINSASA